MEQRIQQAYIDDALVSILLQDKSTGSNLIWATDTYAKLGAGFAREDCIAPQAIGVIRPRTEKSPGERRQRERHKAEVFTPAWLCNRQNSLIDAAWFGRENVFNTPTGSGWNTAVGKIVFPFAAGKTWQEYVTANRLEIACGEAPYLTSRYDAVTGAPVAPKDRIGLLDRKLRVICENAADEREWYDFAQKAFKSVYGFDFQGDNVFMARRNLLLTFIDAYVDTFARQPGQAYLAEIADVLAWNIGQADGLYGTVPYAGTPCRVKNWRTGQVGAADETVPLDAIVGNPPYQVMDGGAQSSALPLYNFFVDAAKKTNARYISMVIPARWYAGGKRLDAFRNSMLNDVRMARLVDYPDSADCFPALGARGIKGGVCYFLRDSEHDGKCRITTMAGTKCTGTSLRYLKEDGCDIFLRSPTGVSVLRKVRQKGEPSFSTVVSPRKPFGMATDFRGFRDAKTHDRDCVVYALKQTGYMDRADVPCRTAWIDAYKLFVPEAIGNADAATDTVKPILAGKGTCCTETYLVIGPFADKKSARNCLSYIQTRFFHFLLSLKKITQHTTRKCYEFIPLQDFSEPWNDAKLYAKYDLSQEEIDCINTAIWPKKRGKE